MRTIDTRVFVAPFPEKGVMQSKTASGIAYVGNYDHLVRSFALADGPQGIKTGDAIYVAGTAVRAPWAKQAFKVGDVEGVLVPIEQVVLIDPPQTVALPPPVPHADEE